MACDRAQTHDQLASLWLQILYTNHLATSLKSNKSSLKGWKEVKEQKLMDCMPLPRWNFLIICEDNYYQIFFWFFVNLFWDVTIFTTNSSTNATHLQLCTLIFIDQYCSCFTWTRWYWPDITACLHNSVCFDYFTWLC